MENNRPARQDIQLRKDIKKGLSSLPKGTLADDTPYVMDPEQAYRMVYTKNRRLFYVPIERTIEMYESLVELNNAFLSEHHSREYIDQEKEHLT